MQCIATQTPHAKGGIAAPILTISRHMRPVSRCTPCAIVRGTMIAFLPPTAATNILIVDDNPDNLRLLAKILEHQGYIIRKALNGRMALQAVDRDPPNLILLDINMPDMNGYEVCQHLKVSHHTATIPIIFISALDCIDDKIQAFEIGGQDYITKPFHEMEVLVRVKNQLLIQHQHQLLTEQNQQLMKEIDERLKAEAEVRQLSLTDELTGLYNRRGFFLLAEQQLKIARRTDHPYCLVFADLDGLKKINDSFGHEVGDRAIVEAAGILTQTFREADIIARLGGDEFVVLIPKCANNSNDFRVRLQLNFDNFNQDSTFTNQYPFLLSMSIGIRCYKPAENFSLNQLLSQADQLMYEQKRNKQAP